MQTLFFHGFSGGGGKPLAPFARELGLDMDDVVLLDMPGFKEKDGLISPDVLTNPDVYLNLAEDRIMPLIKSKKVRVVAYSHGAIPAFLFAAKHPDLVSQLVLVCPASSLHPFVNLLPHVINATSRIIRVDRLIGIMRNRMLVDMMTLYGRKRYWTKDMLRIRLRTRREESSQYNANMLHLMKQLTSFQEQYNNVQIKHTRTVILHTTDDEVIGRNSVQWFYDHTSNPELVSVVGGHAIVSVTPEKAAKHLRPLI